MKEGQQFVFDARRGISEEPPFYAVHGTEGIYLRPFTVDEGCVQPGGCDTRAIVMSKVYGRLIIHARFDESSEPAIAVCTNFWGTKGASCG